MRIFVSYARQDRVVVDALVEDLERLGHTAWHDDDLTGGQAWWNEIIRQLQGCDAMVFVVSPNSSRSEACRLEAGYATDLLRPIVPVQVVPDVSGRLLPPGVAERQFVDYTERDADAIIALTRALAVVAPGTPLPQPLPEPPPVPISYLTSLAQRIDSSAELGADAQRAALAELRARLADDDQRADVVGLLEALQRRADVLAGVARDIDDLFAHLRAEERTAPQAADAGSAVVSTGTVASVGPADPADATSADQPGRDRSPRRRLAVGLGALAAVGLAGVAYAASRGGDGSSGTGTFEGEVDTEDVWVLDVTAPEDSVIVVRGAPIDDFDIMVGVASADDELVERYHALFDETPFDFRSIEDPFSHPGAEHGTLFTYRDDAGSGEQEVDLLPAPLGGDFQVVVGGYAGAGGRAEVNIDVEPFDGPADPETYAEELAEQPFARSAGEGSNGSDDDDDDDDDEPEYVEVFDNTSRLRAEVPESWAEEVDGDPTDAGPMVQASPDLADFQASFSVPGLSLSLREEPTPEIDARLDELVAATSRGLCQSANRQDAVDRLHTGRYEELVDCGGTGTTMVVVVGMPDDQSYTIEVVIQLTADDDPEIGNHIGESIRVAEE